jgi:hypothetical protein
LIAIGAVPHVPLAFIFFFCKLAAASLIAPNNDLNKELIVVACSSDRELF